MSQPRLVRVDWDDAASNDSWRSRNNLGIMGRIQVQTVGYVVLSNAKEMVLAQSLTELDSVSNTLAIPKGCIRKVRRLWSKK